MPNAWRAVLKMVMAVRGQIRIDFKAQPLTYSSRIAFSKAGKDRTTVDSGAVRDRRR